MSKELELEILIPFVWVMSCVGTPWGLTNPLSQTHMWKYFYYNKIISRNSGVQHLYLRYRNDILMWYYVSCYCLLYLR